MILLLILLLIFTRDYFISSRGKKRRENSLKTLKELLKQIIYKITSISNAIYRVDETFKS